MDTPRQHHQPEGHESDTPEIMPPLESDDKQQVAPTAADCARGEGGGHVFLLLHLPPKSTVGYDAKALSTGTGTGTGTSLAFQGLRDIPPGGAHFIWVSAPNAMSRCGYWFVTQPPQPGPSQQQGHVRVKQWDAFNEVLVTPPPSVCDALRADVARLYPRLVPYGLTSFSPGGASRPQARIAAANKEGDDDAVAQQLWRRLTACVDGKLLARVTGRGGAGAGEWLVDTSDAAAGDGAGGMGSLPQRRPTEATTQTQAQTLGHGTVGELHFVLPEGDVDVHTARRGASTEPDTSMDMLRLVDTPGTGIAAADLVGELQFTFLTGLHLSNLACIEQWWHLVLKVMLRAHRLVLLRPRLARALLATFHAQMVYHETYMVSSAWPSAAAAAGAVGDAQHEYGGPGDAGRATSLLDVVPGTKRRLRAALALYGRRLRELLRGQPDGQVTPEQGEVATAFGEVEEWFGKHGWDLRTEDGKGQRTGMAGKPDEVLEEEEDDEDRPVIVDLDGEGREVGLVSFD